MKAKTPSQKKLKTLNSCLKNLSKKLMSKMKIISKMTHKKTTSKMNTSKTLKNLKIKTKKSAAMKTVIIRRKKITMTMIKIALMVRVMEARKRTMVIMNQL